MSEPERIGDIIARCFPSLLKRSEQPTMTLSMCRCCGQLVEGELNSSDECEECETRLNS